MHASVPHVRTLQYLLQSICTRGISLKELSVQLEAIKKQTIRKDWRVTRVLGKRFLADEIPYSMRWTCLELVALYVLDMSYLFVLVSMQ